MAVFFYFCANFNPMKHTFLTLLVCLSASLSFAGNQLTEGFEYGNHDMEKPVGWICDDNTWLCGYQEKDNNRTPHSGDWYAFTESDEAWMFMPFSLFQRMNYRFYFWAISDGDFELSLWAGTAPNAESMHSKLLETNVGSGVYEQYFVYVDEVPSNCQYIGIQSVKSQNGVCVTIDDIEIDMVEQYDFLSTVLSNDTVLYPGSQGTFHYLVKNVGYDPLDITAHPSYEYFSNISCVVDGNTGFTFHLEPWETAYVVVTGTLRPEIQSGTVVWLDIMMTIPCGCNTSMVTFWVTPLDITQISENEETISIYPNPTSDFVSISAEGLQCVNIIDETGRTIKGVSANGNALQLDLTSLKAGTYFISVKTRTNSSFVKPILKM